MEFYMKLPRNKKEMTIFIAIISVISVCIIAPLITCFEIGFNITVWGEAMRVVPFIWISVIIVVLLTHKPADWLTGKIIKKEDERCLFGLYRYNRSGIISTEEFMKKVFGA